jgi:hypothetical protein
LAYVTGLANQELLLQNEYLAAENRILKARLQPGGRLSDGERATLAEIGKRLLQSRRMNILTKRGFLETDRFQREGPKVVSTKPVFLALSENPPARRAYGGVPFGCRRSGHLRQSPSETE